MTLRWNCNLKKNLDSIQIYKDNKIKNISFKKTRETEFTNEIKHIFSIKNNTEYRNSPINIMYGIKTMRIIKKVFEKI